MSSGSRAFVSFILLSLLFVPSLPAQEIPKLGETIEVSIVNVDVFVTDRRGNRVRGLTQDDFEIREDGRPQPITNFAEYAPAGGVGTVGVDAARSASATPAPPVKRTIVVFVDDFTMPSFHTRPFFAGLRDLLHRTVRPGDAVAVVWWWADTPLIRQEFTDDLASIDDALAKIEEQSVGAFNDPTAYLRRQAAFEQAFLAELRSGGRLIASDDTATRRFHSRSEAMFQRFRIQQKTAAIESFMQGMSGAEGKKIMIMAMHRFGLYAGAEAFGGVVPVRYQGDYDTRRYRERLTQMANANGITLYPLYPAGLQSNAALPNASEMFVSDDAARAVADHEVLMNETSALSELADSTGGLMHYGSRNIVELLPRIGDDLESYYSLAYRATTSGKDDVRKIVVTTKNPRYVVRSRTEFVEKSDQSKMNDRVVANLFQPLDATIAIEAEIGEPVRAGGHWRLPLKVRIPVDALTTLDTGNGPSGGFSVYVASGGIFGVMGDVQRRTQAFAIPASELAQAKQSHFTYEMTLEIDSATRRISVGVLDEVSREHGLRRIELPPRGDTPAATRVPAP